MTIESRATKISVIVENKYGINQYEAVDVAYNLLEQHPLAEIRSNEELAAIVATLIEMP